MKNLQSITFVCCCVIAAGCGMHRPHLMAAAPPMLRKAPTRLHIPETASQQEVIVNIYDTREVDTQGPAKVIHHPNGMEIIPAPKPPQAQAPPPYIPPPLTNVRAEPPQIDSGPDRATIVRWTIGITCAGLLFALGYIARRPITQVIRHADLSDGIGDEARKLATEVPAEIQQWIRERLQKEPEPKASQPKTAARKRATAKK